MSSKELQIVLRESNKLTAEMAAQIHELEKALDSANKHIFWLIDKKTSISAMEKLFLKQDWQKSKAFKTFQRFEALKGGKAKCLRCKDWSDQGLSDTCPSCDLAKNSPKTRKAERSESY